jgi:hypothetical protein
MFKKTLFLSFITSIAFFSCKKKEEPKVDFNLYFKIESSANDERLDKNGNLSSVKAGNAAQSPTNNNFVVHYIELIDSLETPLGKGFILYNAAETNQGGENSIDFTKNQYPVALVTQIPRGYYHIRVGVAYQGCQIKYSLVGVPNIGTLKNQTGQLHSFLGYNTYIKNLPNPDSIFTINGNKKQGFWALSTQISDPTYASLNTIVTGQIAQGVTTVVNPLHSTSPIPIGSSIISQTLNFYPLGFNEIYSNDITLKIRFSVNNSIEWKDTNGNGELDISIDPNIPSEKLVDLGLRGLVSGF